MAATGRIATASDSTATAQRRVGRATRRGHLRQGHWGSPCQVEGSPGDPGRDSYRSNRKRVPNEFRWVPGESTRHPGFRLKSTRRLADERVTASFFRFFLKSTAMKSARSRVRKSVRLATTTSPLRPLQPDRSSPSSRLADSVGRERCL